MIRRHFVDDDDDDEGKLPSPPSQRQEQQSTTREGILAAAADDVDGGLEGGGDTKRRNDDCENPYRGEDPSRLRAHTMQFCLVMVMLLLLEVVAVVVDTYAKMTNTTGQIVDQVLDNAQNRTIEIARDVFLQSIRNH
jgi:hypothetical protein